MGEREDWFKVFIKEKGGLLFRDCEDTGISSVSFLNRKFFFKDSETMETNVFSNLTLEVIEALPPGIIVLLDC